MIALLLLFNLYIRFGSLGVIFVPSYGI